MDRAQIQHRTLARFANAKRQFRLLYPSELGHEGSNVTDFDSSQQTALAFESTICDLDAAPTYNAVSYTWGAPSRDPVSITIDGTKREVFPNCRLALWQATLHYPHEHIWIDQICINQSDDEEKSAQIQLMGKIYAGAKRVLVCIGWHDQSSEWLLDGGTANRPLWDMLNAQEQLDLLDSRPTPSLTTTKYGDTVRQVMCRPYWSRLWIIQELAMATQHVILCGADCLSFEKLKAWCKAMGRGDSADIRDPGLLSISVKPKSFHMSDVLLEFQRHGCTDPRDRVFGLLSLIKWEDDQPPVAPDYRLSTYDLGKSLRRYLTDGQALELVPQALRLGFEDLTMIELVRRRSKLVQRSTSAPIRQPLGSSLWHRGQPVIAATTLVNVSTGDLTCSMIAAPSQDLGPHDEAEKLIQSSRDSPRESFDHGPRRILIPRIHSTAEGRRTSDPYDFHLDRPRYGGYVCSGAREGDLLVLPFLHYFIPYYKSSTCLVLRHHSSDCFTVIGQGFLHEDCYYSGRTIAEEEWATNPRGSRAYRAELDTNLDFDDMLVFMAQDLSYQHYPRQKVDDAAMARRLVTNVTDLALNGEPRAFLRKIRKVQVCDTDGPFNNGLAMFEVGGPVDDFGLEVTSAGDRIEDG